eukprot:PhM_4_TR7947/c0_g1_i1/m.53659
MSSSKLVILLCAFLVGVVLADVYPHTVGVHRSLHFESSGTTSGSSKPYLRGLGRIVDGSAAASLPTAATNEVIVIRLTDIPSAPETLLSATTSGVVIVVPSSMDDLSEEQAAAMDALERYIVSSHVEVPVYFAPEGPGMDAILNEIRSDRATSTLVVPERNPSALASTYSAPLFVADYVDASKKKSSDDRPIIILTATYDTMGVVPTLPGRASKEDPRGGATVFLEVLRLYNRVASKRSASHRVVFLLSGGSKLNYFGTRQWLSDLDHITLDNIEFVLSLDSLALSSHKLYLHTARKVSSSEPLQRLHDTVASAASGVGVQIEAVHRKINVSSTEMRWEHEVFAYKKIVAATLSGVHTPSTQYLRDATRTMSRAATKDVLANVRKNTELVCNVISRYLSNGSDTTAFGSSDVAASHLHSWTNFFSSNPLSIPFASKSVLASLRNAVVSVAPGRVVATEPVAHQSTITETKFFGPSTATLTLHKTKSLANELTLTMGIAGYVFVVLIVVSGGVGNALRVVSRRKSE